MGIWIRSQNEKYLINANELYVDINKIFGSHNTISHSEGDFMLGKYNSEEEAINVLDMMQQRINKLAYENIPENPPVFQMPPAGFSTKEDK